MKYTKFKNVDLVFLAVAATLVLPACVRSKGSFEYATSLVNPAAEIGSQQTSASDLNPICDVESPETICAIPAQESVEFLETLTVADIAEKYPNFFMKVTETADEFSVPNCSRDFVFSHLGTEKNGGKMVCRYFVLQASGLNLSVDSYHLRMEVDGAASKYVVDGPVSISLPADAELRLRKTGKGDEILLTSKNGEANSVAVFTRFEYRVAFHQAISNQQLVDVSAFSGSDQRGVEVLGFKNPEGEHSFRFLKSDIWMSKIREAYNPAAGSESLTDFNLLQEVAAKAYSGLYGVSDELAGEYLRVPVEYVSNGNEAPQSHMATQK